jgi:hypothetical protein
MSTKKWASISSTTPAIKLIRRPNSELAIFPHHPAVEFVLFLDDKEVLVTYGKEYAIKMARRLRARYVAQANVGMLRAQKAVAA